MPTAYTPQQNTAILQVRGVTQLDKASSARLLKQYSWNVAAAINGHLSGQTSSTNNATRASLSALFDKYRDNPGEEPDEINVEGTSNLLGELQIGLDDVGALIFSEVVQSPSLGRLTRDGFVEGWSGLNIETPPKMRDMVKHRRDSLGATPDVFRRVYNHTFVLALQPGAKTLPLEIAVEFWRMLFTPPAWEWRTGATPWLDWWLEFQEAKRTKAVNKDLWKQTLAFALETMKDDSLTFWSDESSWPSVIDEFVEWVKTEKRKSGLGAEDPMAVDF